jgi:hypothetical protein
MAVQCSSSQSGYAAKPTAEVVEVEAAGKDPVILVHSPTLSFRLRPSGNPEWSPDWKELIAEETLSGTALKLKIIPNINLNIEIKQRMRRLKIILMIALLATHIPIINIMSKVGHHVMWTFEDPPPWLVLERSTAIGL